MVIWLSTQGPWIGVDGGIIPASEVQSYLPFAEAVERLDRERQALLDQARAQADTIVQNANQQAQVVYAEAQTQGRTQGLTEAARAWHQEHLMQLQDHKEMQDKLLRKLANIVTLAVEKIVHNTPRSDIFAKALTQLESMTREYVNITMCVHPQDIPHARTALGFGSLPESVRAALPLITLHADPTLPPGACVFKSALGVVDAGLDIQLLSLRAAMQQALVHSGLDPVLLDTPVTPVPPAPPPTAPPAINAMAEESPTRTVDIDLLALGASAPPQTPSSPVTPTPASTSAPNRDSMTAPPSRAPSSPALHRSSPKDTEEDLLNTLVYWRTSPPTKI